MLRTSVRPADGSGQRKGMENNRPPRAVHPAPLVHRIPLGTVILHALAQHGVRTAVTAVTIVLSVILEVIPPLILARAVDQLTGSQAVSLVMGLAYFLVLACSGLTDALREALIVATGESITHALRSVMMDKLQRLPAAYYTEHEAGTIASLQVNDVDAIEEMFSSGLVSMFTDLGTVCAVLIVVFTKSTGLGILLVLVLPFLTAFTRHVQKRMLAAHTQNRKATAEAGGILPETLHIIRSLHVYQAEDFAEKRYGSAIEDSFRAMEHTNFYDAVYSPVIMTVSAAVIGIMMSLSGQSGVFRSWFGMSVGTAVAIIAYVNKIFTPLSSIGMEIQTVQSAAAGWKRVQAFLDEDEQPEVPSREEDRTVPAAIDVRDVCFSYGGKSSGAAEASPLILNHFSLTVQRGEFVTLMGRTGAGKSTLFKLLLGLYEPAAGTIRINGIRPQEFTPKARRQSLCCVEQQIIPVPGTIRDQVTLGDTRFDDAAIWKALTTAGLAETVRALPGGLDTPWRDSIFSQGQKQLLMIARAIVSDPDILLLDEITAGLDSATEKMVVTALKKASEGRTVLSISHRLSEVLSGRMIII